MNDIYSRVFISAGHYPKEDGYINESLKLSEHKQALNVINAIHDIRPSNIFEPVPVGDLKSKVIFINKNAIRDKDIAIEIHFNAAPEHNGSISSANGTEILYYKGSVLGKKLAYSILTATSKFLPFNTRGVKERRDLYFLKQTSIPAVIVEVLFLDNNEEASFLLHPRASIVIANTIRQGVYYFLESNLK